MEEENKRQLIREETNLKPQQLCLRRNQESTIKVLGENFLQRFPRLWPRGLRNPRTSSLRVSLLELNALVFPLGTSILSPILGKGGKDLNSLHFSPPSLSTLPALPLILMSSLRRETKAKSFPRRSREVSGEGQPKLQRSEILSTKEKRSIFWPERCLQLGAVTLPVLF